MRNTIYVASVPKPVERDISFFRVRCHFALLLLSMLLQSSEYVDMPRVWTRRYLLGTFRFSDILWHPYHHVLWQGQRYLLFHIGLT